MDKFILPVNYNNLGIHERKIVREQYIKEQQGLCGYCKNPLIDKPTNEILNKSINWRLFPSGFLNTPIHLQHNHKTGMTECAVHSLCNAVMWQYDGR